MNDILLKNVPLDVRKYILKTQWEIKCQKGVSQYSQSMAVIQIIKNQIISDIKKSKKEDD